MVQVKIAVDTHLMANITYKKVRAVTFVISVY